MSKKTYDEYVESTFVEPGHDVVTTDRERAISERACEAVDACLGQRSELVELVRELMRQIEALRGTCRLHDKNREGLLRENEALRDRVKVFDYPLRQDLEAARKRIVELERENEALRKRLEYFDQHDHYKHRGDLGAQ